MGIEPERAVATLQDLGRGCQGVFGGVCDSSLADFKAERAFVGHDLQHAGGRGGRLQAQQGRWCEMAERAGQCPLHGSASFVVEPDLRLSIVKVWTRPASSRRW